VAGGPDESVIQPRYGPDGSLFFVSDRTGWWNLYRSAPGADPGSEGASVQAVAPSEADFAAKRDQIRDTLLQSKEQELFGLFMSNLRDQMEKSGKIKINQDEMKALTRSGSESGI